MQGSGSRFMPADSCPAGHAGAGAVAQPGGKPAVSASAF